MFELTLPYPNYFPTKSSQTPIYRLVPFPVALNLGLPERSVLLGQTKTAGTSVPEASVHKHRYLLPLEGEIRPARNRQMPTPTPYPLSPQQTGQPYFRLLISFPRMRAEAVTLNLLNDLVISL